ncbi:hypothetical protein MLD38_036486 [Melastoma candidum]|uniref:Uncharacterized protein n=1 Tax=Melastoma candidum TaxID=119954 RepID=A0ACB9LKS6_9MYRT|nr:hypothetical protein MLD38_036486 [Melastoma candidum]
MASQDHKTSLLAAVVVLTVSINVARAYTLVSGTVYCDQCRDGLVSLFDYPVFGVKVMLACANDQGQVTMSREENTDWFGGYGIAFDGTPDLSNCYVRIVGGDGQSTTGCGESAGPPRGLRLTFRFFGVEFYSVDPLLSQPARPASFCVQSPVPVPAPPVRPTIPSLPPPRLPPLQPEPPASFSQSACPARTWMLPEYRCYWRVINPETKVAVVFGPVAAQRYGTDLSLFQSLQGRGDPYRTLLREATAALLNSYNSVQFPYHSLAVIFDMNQALLGSTRGALHTALAFMRANTGHGSGSSNNCTLNPCK